MVFICRGIVNKYININQEKYIRKLNQLLQSSMGWLKWQYIFTHTFVWLSELTVALKFIKQELQMPSSVWHYSLSLWRWVKRKRARPKLTLKILAVPGSSNQIKGSVSCSGRLWKFNLSLAKPCRSGKLRVFFTSGAQTMF